MKCASNQGTADGDRRKDLNNSTGVTKEDSREKKNGGKRRDIQKRLGLEEREDKATMRRREEPQKRKQV